MKRIGRLFHPVAALVATQLVWITLVVFWVYWFIGKHRELRDLAARYRPELVSGSANWLVMVAGLLMLAVILAGLYTIFIYWNRQYTLYRQQKNIISQVTHELKSPLASIQLHLETIRLRRLPEDKLDAFVGTMLADTGRLHYLINNLLMAARLEQRRKPPERRLTDISALLAEYVEEERGHLPQGGSISLDAEPGVRAMVDPEEMGMVLRNLFENAALYSSGTPEINVRLTHKARVVELAIHDHGRGLAPNEQKKIFDMFYRVASPGENVRGTGLGLYIVQSIIKGYSGAVRAESVGLGAGCTIVISIPAA